MGMKIDSPPRARGGVRLAIDTSIDEFFDEHLQRVLGAPPATPEEGSWYPAPSKVVAGATDEVPDLPKVDEGTVRAAKSAEE
jgi:hypothetical protein